MVFDMHLVRIFALNFRTCPTSFVSTLYSGILMNAGTRTEGMGSFSSTLGVLMLAAVSVLILKSFGFRGAPLVAAVGIAAALSLYGSSFSEIFGTFSYLGGIADISGYLTSLVKVVGISYLAGISMDICREIGEGGVAKCISLITKLELILIALPYIEEIFDTVLSLLSE